MAGNSRRTDRGPLAGKFAVASPPDGPLRSVSTDGGFTLLEVLVALTILLVVIVGFVQLMTTSLSMALTSKQRSVMVNAANSYIEQARFMSYASLGVVGGDPSGTLPAVTTQTVGGFQVGLRPTVTWFSPSIPGANDMKKLSLAVACTNLAGQVTASYTAEAYIGPHGGVSATTTSGTAPPSVAFDAQSSPADGQVVWGSSVHVGVTAGTADSNSSLSYLCLYIDGVPLQSTAHTSAQWFVGGQSDTESFSWDSTALSDGRHTLVAMAWDTDGQYSRTQRTVVIANSAPVAPTSLTVTGGTATWVPSTVDAAPTSSYTLGTWSQPTNATANSMADWTPARSDSTTGTSFTVSGLSPFSRYIFGVKALGLSGPGALPSLTTYSAAPIVTPPAVFAVATYQNTWSSTKLTMKVTLRLAVPNFPSTQVKHTLIRYTGSGLTAATNRATAINFTTSLTDTPISGKTGVTAANLQDYYYRVKTDITPAGYPGSPPQVTVYSPYMGPNLWSPTSNSGNLVFYRW